jgi:hypothetical protein
MNGPDRTNSPTTHLATTAGGPFFANKGRAEQSDVHDRGRPNAVPGLLKGGRFGHLIGSPEAHKLWTDPSQPPVSLPHRSQAFRDKYSVARANVAISG